MYHLVINGFGKQPESFSLIQFKEKESIDFFFFFFWMVNIMKYFTANDG